MIQPGDYVTLLNTPQTLYRVLTISFDRLTAFCETTQTRRKFAFPLKDLHKQEKTHA